jgi:hypothetical protein
MGGRTYEYETSYRNQLQGEKYIMHDYPELTDKGFPHKFTDNLGSVAASVGRARSLLNLKETPQQQKMVQLHQEAVLFFPGERRMLEEQSSLTHSYSRWLLFLSTFSTHNLGD